MKAFAVMNCSAENVNVFFCTTVHYEVSSCCVSAVQDSCHLFEKRSHRSVNSMKVCGVGLKVKFTASSGLLAELCSPQQMKQYALSS